MEPYELVEAFEVVWPNVPKRIPLGTRNGKQFVYSLFLSAGPLRVCISLAIGPHGGIKEEVVVIDPASRVTADRLVVHSTDGGSLGRGLLLPLADLRHQVMQLPRVQRRDAALALCHQALRDYVAQLDTVPLRPERLRLLPSTSHSMRRVASGGLPSFGGHGGGVPGRS